MKNKILLLTKLNLTTTFSPSRVIMQGGSTSSNPKRRKFGNAFLFAFLGIYFAAMSVGMTKLMYDGLKEVGLQLLIPCLFFVFASLATLMISLFSAQGFLFKSKDLNMLFSFPVKHSDILASKFILLYVYNLALSVLIIGVSGVTFLVLEGASLMGCVSLVAAVFTAPLLPMAVGGLFSYFVGLWINRLKHKNAILTAVTVIFSCGFILLVSSSEGVGSYIMKHGSSIYSAITDYYFPAGLLVSGMGGSIPALFGFVALNLAPIAVLIPLMATRYAYVVASFNRSAVNGKYKYRKQKRNKKSDSCIAKELKRIFSSSNYLLNSGVGILMIIIASISLFQLDGQLSEFGSSTLGMDIMPLAVTFVLMFCGTMSSTTSCTFSLEAKTMWIYKSAPVDESVIFESKAMANNILYMPVTLVSALVFGLVFSFSPAEMLMAVIVPLIGIACSSYLGLNVNLAFPKLEWQNEIQVVKQSASVIVAMLISMAFNVAIIALSVVSLLYLSISVFEVMLCVCAILLCLLLFLGHRLRTKGVRKYRMLY